MSYTPCCFDLSYNGNLFQKITQELGKLLLSQQMVDEVSIALDWTLEHAAAFGGSPKRVTVVGHSAGAQLWMMALLKRAAMKPHRRRKAPACFVGENRYLGILSPRSNTFGRVAGKGKALSDAFFWPSLLMVRQSVVCRQVLVNILTSKALQTGEIRNERVASPRLTVGMAGAYDIGKHFEYEKGRGVAFLSTMSRAIGGPAAFASQSPTAILRKSTEGCSFPTVPNPSKVSYLLQC